MKRENWIKWDLDSRTGRKMLSFYSKHGAPGYGVFMVLIEMLYREADHKLPSNTFELQNYANICKVELEQFDQILSTAILVDLLQNDETCFWSNRVLEECAVLENISNKRRNAVNDRWAKSKMQSNTSVLQPNTKRYRGEEIRSEEIREDNNTDVYVDPNLIRPGPFKILHFDQITWETLQMQEGPEVLKRQIELAEADIECHKESDKMRYQELCNKAKQGKAFLMKWAKSAAYTQIKNEEAAKARAEKASKPFQKVEAPRVQPREVKPIEKARERSDDEKKRDRELLLNKFPNLASKL